MGSFDTTFTGRRNRDYSQPFNLGAFGFTDPRQLFGEAARFDTGPEDYLKTQARVRQGVVLTPEDVKRLLEPGGQALGFDVDPMPERKATSRPAVGGVYGYDGGEGGDGGTTTATTELDELGGATAINSPWLDWAMKNPIWDITYGTAPNIGLGRFAAGGDPVAQGLINVLSIPGEREDILVNDVAPGLGGVSRDRLYDWFRDDFLPFLQRDPLEEDATWGAAGKEVVRPDLGLGGAYAPGLITAGMAGFDAMPLQLSPTMTADILNNLNLEIGRDDIDFDAPGVRTKLLSDLGVIPVGMSVDGEPGFQLAPGVGRDLATALDLDIGSNFTVSPETADIIVNAVKSVIPSSEELFKDIIEGAPGADILDDLRFGEGGITDVAGELEQLGIDAGKINFSEAFQNLLGGGDDGIGNILKGIQDQIDLIEQFKMPSQITTMDDVVSNMYQNLYGVEGMHGGLSRWSPGAGLQSLRPGGDIGSAVADVSELLKGIGDFSPGMLGPDLKGLRGESEALLKNLDLAKGSFTDTAGGLNQLMNQGNINAGLLKKTLEDAAGINIDLPELGELPQQIEGLAETLPGLDTQLRSLIIQGRAGSDVLTAISNIMSGQMPTAGDIATIVDAVNEGLQLPDEVLGRLQRSIGEMATKADGISTALGAAEGRISDIKPPTLEQVGADQIMGALDLPTQETLLRNMSLPNQQMLLNALDMPDEAAILGALDLPTQETLLRNMALPNQQMLLNAMDMPDQAQLLDLIADGTGLTTENFLSAFPGIEGAITKLTSDITDMKPDFDLKSLEKGRERLATGFDDLQTAFGGLEGRIDDFDVAGALDVPGKDDLLNLLASGTDLTSDQFLAAFPEIGTALSGLSDLVTGPEGLGAAVGGLTEQLDNLKIKDFDSDQFAQDFMQKFVRGLADDSQSWSDLGEFSKLNQAFRDVLLQNQLDLSGGLGEFFGDNFDNLFQEGTYLGDLIGSTGELANFLSPMNKEFWGNLEGRLTDQITEGDLERLAKRVIEESGGGGGGEDILNKIRALLEGDGAVAGTTANLTGTAGWMKELQDQIRAGFGRDPSEFGVDGGQTYADYLRQDPITASLIADYQAEAGDAEAQLREDMNRMGLLGGGGNTGTTDMGNVLGDFLDARSRGEASIISDAAKRAQDLRVKAMDQGTTLSDLMSRRDIGIGELMGYLGGDRTLAGREADMDVIAAAVAALDPDLKLGEGEIPDNNRQLFNMIISQLDLPPETIAALGQIIGITPSSYKGRGRDAPDGTPK
tara:strand:- start:3295 stop:7089 length:3795 start_codon:yes stop_codon:yes gene_type:complete